MTTTYALECEPCGSYWKVNKSGDGRLLCNECYAYEDRLREEAAREASREVALASWAKRYDELNGAPEGDWDR